MSVPRYVGTAFGPVVVETTRLGSIPKMDGIAAIAEK
jgi:hypothetical protein